MRLEVFNLGLRRLGMVNQFSMVQYTEKFCGVGSFTLSLPITDDNIRLLKKNRILWLEEDVAGVIQYVEKVRDNSTNLTVKGSLLSCILDWRWVYPSFIKTGNPIQLMVGLVNTHCVNPSNSNRKFTGLSTIGNTTDKPSVSYQKTGGSVREAIEELGLANDLGYSVVFNPRWENPLAFKVLSGKYRGKDNYNPVIFSQSLNNIIKGEYIYNDEAYRCVALVAGEAVNKEQEEVEGSQRRTIEVGNTESSGLYRRELYVDARDLQSEYSEEEEVTDEEGNTSTQYVEKTLSDEEYLANLTQRGNEKLSEHPIEESYSGEVRTDSDTIFRYGRDYFLGDTVIVQDEELGVMIDATVTEMTVTYDSTGYSYEPTFGYGLPTLENKIKRSV